MRIFRNPDAMWREEDLAKEKVIKGLGTGEDVTDIGTSIILLHGKMHALNILGTEIWKLCDGRTFDEIVSVLKENFEVELEVLKKDGISFLAELKKEGLVYEE
jgi:GeoRSP system PqqD family protein